MSKTGKQVTTRPSTPQFQEYNEPKELIELCLNCKYPDCISVVGCKEYRRVKSFLLKKKGIYQKAIYNKEKT